MKKNLAITKLRYSEHILPVRWPFVKSRFHFISGTKGVVRVWEKRAGKSTGGGRRKVARKNLWEAREIGGKLRNNSQ